MSAILLFLVSLVHLQFATAYPALVQAPKETTPETRGSHILSKNQCKWNDYQHNARQKYSHNSP